IASRAPGGASDSAALVHGAIDPSVARGQLWSLLRGGGEMLAIHGRSRSAIASMASKRYHAQSIARPIPLKPLAWDSQEQLPGFPLQSNSSLRSQFLARWRSYRFPEYRPHSIWLRRAARPCLHRPADTVAISQLSSVLLSVARPRHRGAAW